MSTITDDDVEISYALVCLKTGAVLGAETGDDTLQLEELAAASLELFSASKADELSALFTRLGGEQGVQSFQEIMLVSRRGAHVVQPLRGRPDTALLAVCRDIRKLGLMRAGIRARVEREAKP